jgi:RNA polymerase sigma-70 factor (ECF subfamily)
MAFHPEPHLPHATGSDARATAEQKAVARADASVDAGLVRQVLEGDDEAFRCIVQRHSRRLFAIVKGCLRDRRDVEEVVDDAFLRAYRCLPRFRGQCSLGTWLYHIAINLARNRHGFLFRRRHLTTSLDAPVSSQTEARLADFVASDAPDPGQVLDTGEFSSAVDCGLTRLRGSYRTLLKLRGEQDHSYAQIAAEMGTRVTKVKSQLSRARRQLRKEMAAARKKFRFTPDRRLRSGSVDQLV